MALPAWVLPVAFRAGSVLLGKFRSRDGYTPGWNDVPDTPELEALRNKVKSRHSSQGASTPFGGVVSSEPTPEYLAYTEARFEYLKNNFEPRSGRELTASEKAQVARTGQPYIERGPKGGGDMPGANVNAIQAQEEEKKKSGTTSTSTTQITSLDQAKAAIDRIIAEPESMERARAALEDLKKRTSGVLGVVLGTMGAVALDTIKKIQTCLLYTSQSPRDS